VFYADLVPEIFDHLRAMPLEFDLLVTNASGNPLELTRDDVPMARNMIVLDVENRGRDIWPLAQLVNAGYLDPYLVVLKLHTKRSAWRDAHAGLGGTGDHWRAELLSALLGSEANVIEILEAFAATPRLGSVTADGSVLGPEFWGDNQAVTRDLLRRLELEPLDKQLRFASGSMYWIRGFVLQALRALRLESDDFEDELGQVNATTAHAMERLIGLVTHEAGLHIVERSEITTQAALATAWHRFRPESRLRPRARVIPFYLPQFHPVPENDRWWGPGFTEWTSVSRARPVYPGHHQPKLPADTGFYDLRLPETVALQASLAASAGIAGFMYYHYWFAGKQVLEGPINARLDGAVDLSFCLMWANENWTRRWDGREVDVLVGQDYGRVSSARFIDSVLPILRDPRYLRIDGRAVLAIYRPGQVPDLAEALNGWRAAAREAGVGELAILSVDVVREFHGLEGDLGHLGLDGRLGFPPHNGKLEWLSHESVGLPPGFRGNLFGYRGLADDAISRLTRGLIDSDYPGVMVAFDNTARRQEEPDIWYGSNPYTFRRWLAAAVASVAQRDPDRRVVFINAWNEWAEGAVLEPTERFGRSYLLAVRDVVHG
jgi:lipopolysaccharide biosynthesis protein